MRLSDCTRCAATKICQKDLVRVRLRVRVRVRLRLRLRLRLA